MRNLSRADGFTITEMMVATAVVLLVVLSGALTTFKNALTINDSASQLADANQNLRAGTNQLIRDLLMAGRIIGTEGIAMPTGPGITFARPGPVAMNFAMVADGDPTLQLPSITTGYQLGPDRSTARTTDMITILTVDEFMPIVTTPPTDAADAAGAEATISPDGTYVTFAADLAMDRRRHGQRHAEDQGRRSRAVHGHQRQRDPDGDVDRHCRRIASISAGNAGDFFHFNQPNATNAAGTGRPLHARSADTSSGR